MDTSHHMKENLRRLKLPGIADSFESRCREAEDNELGYSDFLSLLIQDEVLNRESNNFQKRIRNAGFGKTATFEGFDYGFNRETFPKRMLRDWSNCNFVFNNQNLVLCGPPGIGKTHIAKAIGHEICRRGHDVIFRKTHKLLSEVNDDSYVRRSERIWKQAVSAKLLILDDFAFRAYDQREAEMLYALSDERLGKSSTIITSNRPVEDWFSIFPDPVIGGAILDRFVSGSIKLITAGGRSYRKERSFSPVFENKD